MIDYKRYKLSFNEAKNIIDSIDNLNDTEFTDLVRHWALFDVPDTNYADIYQDVRKEVIDVFKQALNDNDNRVTYNLDLRVGIKLYEMLNPDDGFNVIAANDDDIWRYISVKVMPDITFLRYPNLTTDVEIIKDYIPGYSVRIDTEKDSARLKKKRFYSHTRRIWLKTLWWYIHLGWQGSSIQTYDVLINNGTNIISHFIERPGRGYREGLFRSMLYAYSLLPEQKDKIFRAAAKLNLAKCISLEPALTEGGESAYAIRLFEEVNDGERNQDNVEAGNRE